MSVHLAGMRRFVVCLALSTAVLPSASAQWHVGIEGGGDSGGNGAVEGFPDTKFQSTRAYGASLGYRFGLGLNLEAAFLTLSPKLVENGVSFGTATFSLAMLRAGLSSLPEAGHFGGHFALGFGVVGLSFEPGPAIRTLEGQYGVTFDSTETGDDFAFDMVFGGEYFLTPWLSLGCDARLLVLRRGTAWEFKGSTGNVPVPEVDTYVLLSGEITAVMRLWLRR